LAEPVILEQVKKDNVFVTEKEWERINAKAVIDTETVDKVSDIVVDTTLKVMVSRTAASVTAEW